MKRSPKKHLGHPVKMQIRSGKRICVSWHIFCERVPKFADHLQMPLITMRSIQIGGTSFSVKGDEVDRGASLTCGIVLAVQGVIKKQS